MEIKEGVIDRIGLSFVLFKNNFIGLFLPIFLYNFVSIVIIGTLSKYYIMKSFTGINNLESLDFFNFLNNSTVVIGIIFGIISYIAYLLLYIVFFLGLLKSIKQAINSEKITIMENIYYGINRFTDSMKTYWYIFAYVGLIPAIIFIIGGFFFNAGYYFSNTEILKQIGGLFISISLFVIIYFAIYRGIKSRFALYSAVNKESFTKENFYNSINATNNNWWRILGNYLLILIFIGILTSIISGIIGIIGFLSSGGVSLLDTISSIYMQGFQSGKNEMMEIKNILENYMSNFSLFGQIISNTIKNILTTISSVYIIIFSYIFFLRLKFEHHNRDEQEHENEKQYIKSKIEL